LRTILPAAVRVGFSAATGQNSQISNILSGEFNSSLSDAKPAPAPEPVGQTTSLKSSGPARKSRNTKVGLVSGAIVVSFLSIGLGLVGFMWWRRRSDAKYDGVVSDLSDDFESGTGPRRFTYGELSRATNNFVEERAWRGWVWRCLFRAVDKSSWRNCSQEGIKRIKTGEERVDIRGGKDYQ